MRVIGIDPGISHTGYGIIEKGPRGTLTHTAHGAISTSPQEPFVERLLKIHAGLSNVMNGYCPDCLAIEEIFVARNVRSALLLGHARGVILLAAGIQGIPVFEYPSTTIKTALCRFGHATKGQVTSMVKTILKLDQDLNTHAADALATCICHVHSQSLTHRIPASASCNHLRTRSIPVCTNLLGKDTQQ